jgi:predicted transposase YdaD
LVNSDILEAVKDSHINPELQEVFSDAVYSTKTGDKEKHAYLLFEHKSYEDSHAGAQVFENIAMVFQYHRKFHGRKGKTPLMLPVLIYQGTSVWNHNGKIVNTFKPFQGINGHLADLDIRFALIELHLLPDNMIRGVPCLRILFLTFKYIRSAYLLEKIRDIIVIFKELDDDPDAPEVFEAFIKYLEATVDEKRFSLIQDEIKKILNEWRCKMSSMLENVLEDIINDKLKEVAEKSERIGFDKGVQEGIQEGIQQGIHKVVRVMINMGADNKTISEATEMSIEEIERIRNNPG